MLLVPAFGLVQIANGAEEVTLEDRFRAHVAAVNDGEIEKNLSFFADDATFIMGTSVLRGKDALRKLFQRDAAQNCVLTVIDARTDGNTVTATVIERNDLMKAQGVDEAQHTAEIDFRDGLITQIRLKLPDRWSLRGFGVMPGTFLGLLRRKPVEKELKLSEDQIGKVNEVAEKLWKEMREQLADLREIEDRQEQRAKMAKMTELGDQFDGRAHEQVREILSEDQMRRLYQIRLQVRGAVYGLNNRWIADRLELTDEQKQKAAELDKATQDKIFDAFGSFRDLSQEQRLEKIGEVREKIGKIRSEADEQALRILSAEQREALEKMKGEILEL
jgi:ketosteroid isomerase-like protein